MPMLGRVKPASGSSTLIVGVGLKVDTRRVVGVAVSSGFAVAVGSGCSVGVGVDVRVGVGVLVGVAVGPGVDVAVGVGVEVGVGVTVTVGVGLKIQKLIAQGGVGVKDNSWAGAGFGAVGATGFLPSWYSLIEVTIAIEAKAIVATTIRMMYQFLLRYSILIEPVPKQYKQ